MRDRFLSGAALASIAGAALGIVSSADAQVAWRSGVEEAPIVMAWADVARAMASLAARPDASHVVVQFARPITPAERRALSAAGLELGAYLSGDSYFASTVRQVNVPGVLAAAPVTGVREIRTEWKLDPSLLNGEIPRYAIVAVQSEADPTVTPDNPIVGTYVMLHGDQAVDQAALDMVANHGGTVKNVLVSFPALVVELPFNNIRGLVDEDAVLWVEPPLAMGPVNDSNRARTGADIVRQPPYGLDGTGVTAFVYDAGTVDNGHPDFGSRVTKIDSTGEIDHATHVAGTVGGNDVGGPYSGMAPNVTLLSAGFEWGGGDGFL